MMATPEKAHRTLDHLYDILDGRINKPQGFFILVKGLVTAV